MLRFIGALSLGCVLLTGCIPDSAKRAEIAAENEKERALQEVPVVRDVADFGNVQPIQVSGIGLVTGLAGTGHSPPGWYRNKLEQYLLKNMGESNGAMRHVPKDQTVRQMLDDPDNCLVIVHAFIPPGARKGDRFDVEVSLPVGSKATSLAGGYLQVCLLQVYEAAANLTNNPMYKDAVNPNMAGHVYGQAKGPLVVGFGNNSDPNELKRARIWQGGTSRINRPYSLIMRNDGKAWKIANDVASRINLQFQDDPLSKARQADFTRQEKNILVMGNLANQFNQSQDPTGMNQQEMAKAVSKEVINVRVPFLYRLDHERFLHVSGFTPLRNNDPALVAYRKRLEAMLVDPRDTWRAARRLEALGRDSIPSLQFGLKSDHPFVRFASADALAYLGSTAGVDELAQLARQHPIFVRHCTTALANLGENICRDRLAELLAGADPALRCAAFHALSQLDENDKSLGGLFLNQAFWLHHIPQSPSPMVYFSTAKRAQVVLFGRNIVLAPDTRMAVGKDYTVAAGGKDGQFLVKRITVLGDDKRICTNRLDEILIGLTELGATYPDIVDFLRKAEERKCVNCPIVIWTTPEVRLETLVESGKQMKSGT